LLEFLAAGLYCVPTIELNADLNADLQDEQDSQMLEDLREYIQSLRKSK
jgi:hypothetical protein